MTRDEIECRWSEIHKQLEELKGNPDDLRDGLLQEELDELEYEAGENYLVERGPKWP